LGPRLVKNLDEETARRAEVERPAAVEVMGRLRVEAVGLQPAVDRVHLLPAVLPEADVEGPRVGDFLGLREVVQAQNEPRLVKQHDEGVALGGPVKCRKPKYVSKNARVCGTLGTVRLRWFRAMCASNLRAKARVGPVARQVLCLVRESPSGA